MAKGNAIVMYLEQARIHGEPIGVTHSEVLFTKPNGYVITPGGQQINYVCVDAFNGHNDVTGYDALQKDDGTVVWGSAELIVYTCLGDAYNVRVACFNRA